jgi:hypothetical protein
MRPIRAASRADRAPEAIDAHQVEAAVSHLRDETPDDSDRASVHDASETRRNYDGTEAQPYRAAVLCPVLKIAPSQAHEVR